MSLTIAPSTQFSSGKAGSKLLKQKAGEFLQCTRATDVLLELIAYHKVGPPEGWNPMRPALRTGSGRCWATCLLLRLDVGGSTQEKRESGGASPMLLRERWFIKRYVFTLSFFV